MIEKESRIGRSMPTPAEEAHLHDQAATGAVVPTVRSGRLDDSAAVAIPVKGVAVPATAVAVPAKGDGYQAYPARGAPARGAPKGRSSVLAVGFLLASLLLTACGSDADPDEESSSDATLTTVEGASDDSATSGESNVDGASSDSVSITPDDLAGDGIGMPAEDQDPPSDELIPVIVSNATYRVMEIDPPQVIIEVSGEMTDPCQTIWSRWETDEDNTTYNVWIWGRAMDSADDSLQCAQMLQPFTEDVFLDGPAEFGGFPPGQYTVVVNNTITLDIVI